MSDWNEISSTPKNCYFYSIPNMFIIGTKDDVRLSHYKYGPSVDLANSRLVIGWDIIKFSDDEDLQNKRLFYSLSFESVFLCCLMRMLLTELHSLILPVVFSRNEEIVTS